MGKASILKKPKRTKTLIILIIIAAAIIAVVLVLRSRAVNAAAQVQVQPLTMLLEKGEISNTISVSGVIGCSESTNIYSTQSYPVKEIYAEVGDSVKAGDILAELDMSKLDNEISQAEINYNSALSSREDEIKNNNNSLANAALSLESAEISYAKQVKSVEDAEKSLREAELALNEEFDSYSYDNSIKDAEITLNRKKTSLEKAKEELNTALNKFDDYTYQNNINETKINLSRKKEILKEAKTNLTDTQKDKTTGLNETKYQNAINTAENIYQQAVANYATAQMEYQKMYEDYISGGVDWDKVDKAKSLMDSANDAVNEAYQKLEDSKNGLTDAKSNYNDQYEDTLTAAEKTVKTAQDAVDDAQRSYDKALTDLERAKRDAVKNASDKYENAEEAYTDAQRSYKKALTDKERAAESSAEDKQNKLETAQKAYDDSVMQLRSAEISLKTSKNSYNQTAGKTVSDSNVDLKELSLEKLIEQQNEGKIIAETDGVITEINAAVGTTSNGIMFVIENTDKLYASAKVTEYNLSSVKLGQEVNITTDATGDSVYKGTITYISPKAVSAAGSTSVEFEVRAELSETDINIKIGMNAFLNIITAQKSDVFTVPITAIISSPNGGLVFALENDERKPMPVTIGIKNSVMAEISGDGLYDGMVLLSDPEGTITSSISNGRPNMSFGGAVPAGGGGGGNFVMRSGG